MQVLDQMEMVSAFTDVLHVANLNTGSHLMSILKQSDAFSKDDLAKLAAKLSGRKANIGVKKLLGLIDMVKQTDPRSANILEILKSKEILFLRSRVNKLLSKLEEENFIELVA